MNTQMTTDVNPQMISDSICDNLSHCISNEHTTGETRSVLSGCICELSREGMQSV